MGEVLSQSEIDSLLNALSTGELDMDEVKETPDKQVKEYDFRRPAKFSKEHLRTLEIIFEHYGRLLSTTLPVYLREPVQVTVASSETVTFSEFTNALANPVVLGITNFQPLGGTVIMELAASVAYAIIDRMLGGAGVPLEKSREFTDIEMRIVDKVMVICIQLLREPWKNVADINPVLEKIETNPQFAQVISPTDMIAIVTLNIRIGDVEGFMNICLPYFTLESIMDRLNTKFWFANMQERPDESYYEQIETMIRKVDVPIRAILGRSRVLVNDFVNLQVGDVIRLDTKLDSELDVYVGNIKKFKALPGSNEEHFAVRVTSVIREEE